MILVAQRSREMKKFQRQVKIYQEKTERLKHIGVCVCVTVYTYSSNFNLGKEGEWSRGNIWWYHGWELSRSDKQYQYQSTNATNSKQEKFKNSPLSILE